MTVKKEDLTFEAKWELVASRNDYLTALVMYFDVGFTQIHKPVCTFSSSLLLSSLELSDTKVYEP